MAVITRAYSEVSGTIAHASSVNRVIDDLYTLQNGNLNSANLAASGVANTNIETSAVITRTLNNQSVTYDKLDYEAILAVQVFS